MGKPKKPEGYGIEIYEGTECVGSFTVTTENEQYVSHEQGIADWVSMTFHLQRDEVKDLLEGKLEYMKNPLASFKSFNWVMDTVYYRSKNGKQISLKTLMIIFGSIFILLLASLIVVPMVIATRQPVLPAVPALPMIPMTNI